MHEHFDAKDQPCSAAEAFYTIVTREPEWDDSARARATRLEEIERDIDGETGLPRVEAYTKQPFIVHNDVVNYAAKAIAKKRADDAEAHGDNYSAWSEGRRYVAVPATPEQIEAARRPDPTED